MDVNHNEVGRCCVVWFGQPGGKERSMLAAAGWQLRVVAGDAPARIGMRTGDRVIGLVDLRALTAEQVAPLARLLEAHSELPLIALDGSGAVEQHPALERILTRCGERLVSPVNPAQLAQALTACERNRADTAGDVDRLVGASPAMLDVRATVHRYARVDLPVLITGETGTGKELAARALHDLSARRWRPFVAVNCGALSPTLVQSELFGHERGAFTGANARRLGLFETGNGGTVFLDEIGDLPADAQTSLLRVLQEGTLERVGSNQSVHVDVRVLAATHVDLEQAVEQGRFRQDLYYRLDVLRLDMPPLRVRGDDIELLARRVLEEFREHNQVRARGFDAEARHALRAHAWPGNVRELLNRVRRAAVVTEQELIRPADLHLADPTLQPAICLDDRREHAERQAVLDALRACGYNVSECARRLRVSRVTVYRLCRKHQLQLPALR